MMQERLNNLASVSIENDLLDKVNFNVISNKFTPAKSH